MFTLAPWANARWWNWEHTDHPLAVEQRKGLRWRGFGKLPRRSCTAHIETSNRYRESTMAELSDDLHEKIEQLCAEGNNCLDEKRVEDALACFSSAWELLPEPRTDWEAATWILGAIADAHFLSGNFAAMRQPLMTVMQCDGATGNPFLRLRLGQCLFELGDLKEAANWLAGAYLQEARSYLPRTTPSISHSSSQSCRRRQAVGQKVGDFSASLACHLSKPPVESRRLQARRQGRAFPAPMSTTTQPPASVWATSIVKNGASNRWASSMKDDQSTGFSDCRW